MFLHQPFLFLRGKLKDIQAGDTFRYSLINSKYPTSDGWIFNLSLRGKAQIDIIGTYDAAKTEINFNQSSAVSSLWTPGHYAFFVYAKKDDERELIESGEVNILPDYSGKINVLSWAEKALEAVEATIQNRATSDQLSYTIAGRSLSKIPIPDLLSLRSTLKAQIRSEKIANNLAEGLPIGNNIKVSM